ncbi:MAG: hypothetical protein FWC84_08240, partial [Alphaproteobacteria bacterium]|nr:hypothetical protein [Alphaproteobacteria bacterium]
MFALSQLCARRLARLGDCLLTDTTHLFNQASLLMLVPFGFRLILRLLRQQDGIADKACAAAHNEGSIGSVILVQALAREFRQQPSAALTADA